MKPGRRWKKMHNNFRFEYQRIGKEIRTDRQIQIYTPQGHIAGHIEASFGEWILQVLLPVADMNDTDTKRLFESLDDAVRDCKKHRRSISDASAGYEPHITHKP
jgi:hypothetical protein